MLECLDLSRVKKAGPFLEDCKIYLSGFTDSEAEFLDKVINAANGHRMNQVSFIFASREHSSFGSDLIKIQ